jgi:hypothetical protein
MQVVSRSVALATLLLVAPLVVSAQTAPKADEIFARHVAAIGGEAAIMQLSSIKTVGTMQMVSMGITANVEAISAAPNLSSMKMTIPGMGQISNGYDGTVAWELNPMQGPRVKTETERIAAAEQSDFYGSMLFSKNRYQSYETVGAADFGGEKAWKVKTVLKSGHVVNEFFSVATGLKIGSQSTQENAKGTVDVVIVESDYKQFGPIRLATKSETLAGASKMLVTISSVDLTNVPESAFALPESIRALVGKP